MFPDMSWIAACLPGAGIPVSEYPEEERDVWELLTGLSEEVTYRGTLEQENTLSDAHLDMAQKLVHALVKHHNYMRMTHVANELAARNLRIWLIPMLPQPHHIAKHPHGDTASYTHVLHIFFGTDAQYAGLLHSLGETPATIEAKLEACAFEVEA